MTRWNRQPHFRVRQGGDDFPYEEVRVFNPSRGLNLLVAPELVNDKEFTAGTKNIEYVEGGGASKRMGFVTVGSGLSNPTNGIGQYMSESSNYILTSDGGTIKKFTSGVWSALPGAITLDSVANINFTALFQKTYGWDGVNGGVVWDGTTLTRPGTMPRAKASVTYKGYHVAFGVAGQPFRLYLAPSNEPSRFTYDPVNATPATDDIDLINATEVPGATVFTGSAAPRAIDINKNDGQKIIGCGFFQDLLIVFKERSIYQVYFNASNGFVVERISASYGAVSHGSICSVENDCYFLTDKGVFVLGNEPNYYATIRTNELSSRIRGLIEQINPALYEKCRSIYWKDRYFLTVPMTTSTINNSIIVYDRRFYAWAEWTNLNANDFLFFVDKDVDGKGHFYFTDSSLPRLNEFTPGVWSDNGNPITQTIRTRAFEGKGLEIEKYWYKIRPIFRKAIGTINISYITEYGSAGSPLTFSAAEVGGLSVDEIGAVTFGTSQHDTYTDLDMGLSGTGGSGASANSSSNSARSHIPYDLSVNIDSRTLMIEYSNATLNEGFTLLGSVIYYQKRDFERFDGSYTIR